MYIALELYNYETGLASPNSSAIDFDPNIVE